MALAHPALLNLFSSSSISNDVLFGSDRGSTVDPLRQIIAGCDLTDLLAA